MQNTNIVASYDYYTLEQARQIIAKENMAIKAKKRNKIICYAKQKLLGLSGITLSIIELALGHIGVIEEGGIFIIALPIGLWLLFTKEKIYFSEKM